jgi:Tol biopolymer transport system component
MPEASVASRINSWKEIAAFLGRDVRTVIRWEKERRLPIHRVPGGKRQGVFAYRHELEQWLNSSPPEAELEHAQVDDDIVLSSEPKVSDATSSETEDVTELLRQPKRQPNAARLPMIVKIAASVVALVLGILVVRWILIPDRLQFTGLIPLTGDGVPKIGLATDGRNIYFGEYRDGKVILATVAARGGPIRFLPTPFLRALPADVSADGKDLLVMAREGEEEDAPLWIVPVAREAPRRAGEIRCHAAAWSPDGRRIAFANQNAVYIADSEQFGARKIQTFAGVPQFLRWFPDGKRLRLVLRDTSNLTFSLWDIVLDDKGIARAASFVPLHVTMEGVWNNSIAIDRNGDTFFRGGESWKERLFVLRLSTRVWDSTSPVVNEMNRLVAYPSQIAMGPQSHTLLVTGQLATNQLEPRLYLSEMIWFDNVAHEFRPFLPGISGTDVDFSKDGKRIVYVRTSDNALWTSDADGTNAIRIPLSTNEVELPRWSPDGTSIAFMARNPESPWHVFIVPSVGGKPREASSGTDNQGAPTWSPDGKSLVYGNVKCQESGSCAIHKINLSTGQTIVIPGSEGLGTARWSPDGRYIAALRPNTREVYVYDVKRENWRKVADGVNGNDLSWSADSKYILASKPAGDHPQILRISVEHGTVVTAFDLSSFVKLSGYLDTWFAVAPDGSVVFRRDLSSNEIYALDYRKQ